MWPYQLFGALALALGLLVLLARPAELLLLRWYESEVANLDIPERADETIVTYPLA